MGRGGKRRPMRRPTSTVPPVGRIALIAVALLALVAVAPAEAARSKQRVTLALDGGTERAAAACGAQRTVTAVPEGADARAVTRLIDGPRMRHGGRHARLLVDRCDGGRWQRVSDERFGTVGRYRRVRRYRLALPTAEHGDFRVRAVLRAGPRRRAARSPRAYLRVGVGEVADVPLDFAVDNVNRSIAPCEADGRRYRLSGHLVAPRAALAAERPAVTLFLHGVEISGAYYRYRGVPGYDFQTEMAQRGHATVVVDRLGHGRSDLPPGEATCVGAQADMAHQVLDQLRARGYRVALAGHSFGSYIAEVAAMSWSNYELFVGMAFAAEGINAPMIAEYSMTGETGSCTSGGHDKRPGGPGGYASLWPTTDQWAADTFFNVEPAVLEQARAFRQRSPCGELTSAVPTGPFQPANYRAITTPVLLVFARQDKVFPPPAGERHRMLFTGSGDVTLVELDQTGHTLMLQRTAEEFRAKLSDWLKARGF